MCALLKCWVQCCVTCVCVCSASSHSISAAANHPRVSPAVNHPGVSAGVTSCSHADSNTEFMLLGDQSKFASNVVYRVRPRLSHPVPISGCGVFFDTPSRQGCALGLNVSVWRRSGDPLRPWPFLGRIYKCLVLSLRTELLVLSHLRLVHKSLARRVNPIPRLIPRLRPLSPTLRRLSIRLAIRYSSLLSAWSLFCWKVLFFLRL